MERIQAHIEDFQVTSSDGTRIQAYSCGKGPHRWLLPPGLGTPVSCWRYLFEYFQEHMTIVTWEPRGCYRSGQPADPSRITVEDHVLDGFAVADAVDWLGKAENKKYVTGGWSMGIQIGLEMYRHQPENVAGLTLINGAYEHVLRTAFAFLPYPDRVLGAVLKALSRGAGVAAPLSRYLLGQPWAIEFLQNLGIVAENEAFFGEVLGDFKELDFGFYFPMILALNKHSAREILPLVDVPTLVTAGTMDKMTPLSVSEDLHRRIRDSELFVIPNGTHYTTIEYPEIVNLKLEQFFRNRVFPGSW